MSQQLAPVIRQRFFDATGAPLSGGFLYTYAAGTSTPQVTYTDYTGGTPNANPVVLDSNGYADVWLTSQSYKFVLEDANSNVLWTRDNVTSLGVGAQGVNFLIGTGAPSNGNGNNGDSYMDVNTGNIYQKASNTWTIYYANWTKFSVTDGQSATSLSGQTVDGTVYTSAIYKYEVIRGTTVLDNGTFYLQYLNSTWVLNTGDDAGTLSGVTFSITQSTSVAQLKAALDAGAGNGTIKVSRTLVPV